MSNSNSTNANRAASSRESFTAKSTRAVLANSGHKTSRAQANAQKTREFQVLLLDDKFPRLLESVSQSLQNLTFAVKVEGIDRNRNSNVEKELEFANYNSLYLALKAARSRFRKFSNNRTTATEKERKLFYSQAIQILPTLKRIASLQAPKLRSHTGGPFLTQNSFLFDFVIADSQHQNPSIEKARQQVQNPILVGGTRDGLRYGIDESYGKFAWKVFDEKFENHLADLEFEVEEAKRGKPSRAQEMAHLSIEQIAALLPLQIEEKAIHKTLEELVLEPIKALAQSTYQELNKVIDNGTSLLSQMTDPDINSAMSRFQLSPQEQKMSMQELLARDTSKKDHSIPEIAATNKIAAPNGRYQRVKKISGNQVSRVPLNHLEKLLKLQKSIDSLIKEPQVNQEQIYREITLYKNDINEKDFFEMTLEENERAYKALLGIASRLSADGLNNKKVHDDLNKLIAINSQIIYHRGKQEPTSQALSGDAVRQKIEKQNVFQILSTTLDKMIEMAQTWTMPNFNLADSLKEISKGKSEFKFSVLKQTKFSSKELEILQEKIRHVISSVPQASHGNSFIKNLIEIDRIMSDQLIQNTSKARSESTQKAEIKPKTVSRSRSALAKVKNPLRKWEEAVNRLKNFASKKINLSNLKKNLASILKNILHLSRDVRVLEKLSFQSIQDQIFQTYSVFAEKKSKKIPSKELEAIQDLFLSTALKLEEMHNPKLAA